MDAEKLLYEMTHLNIDQMMELVKKSGNTKDRRFRATGPKSSIEGTIYDPYLGIVTFDGEDGFVMANDLRFVFDVTYELI